MYGHKRIVNNALQLIQRIQRKFTCFHIAVLSYHNRLIESNLQSLEMGRPQFDLVMTYEIQFGEIMIFLSHANYG